MRKYEIWSEGYIITGESGSAQLLGVRYADSFDGAVQSLPPEDQKYIKRRESDGHWVYWGCELFDNEPQARRRYG